MAHRERFASPPPPRTTPRKRALLIGCNYEENEAFVRLFHTHNDVIELKKLLIEVYNHNEDEIAVLLDDGKHEPPTRKNIIRGMKSLVANAISGDMFFFHFCGHGSLGECKPRGNIEADGMDEAIVPCDATGEKETWILDNEMNDLLVREIPVMAQLVAIFDMCNFGTALDPRNYSCTINEFNRMSHDKDPSMSIRIMGMYRKHFTFATRKSALHCEPSERFTSIEPGDSADPSSQKPKPVRKKAMREVVIYDDDDHAHTQEQGSSDSLTGRHTTASPRERMFDGFSTLHLNWLPHFIKSKFRRLEGNNDEKVRRGNHSCGMSSRAPAFSSITHLLRSSTPASILESSASTSTPDTIRASPSRIKTTFNARKSTPASAASALDKFDDNGVGDIVRCQSPQPLSPSSPIAATFALSDLHQQKCGCRVDSEWQGGGQVISIGATHDEQLSWEPSNPRGDREDKDGPKTLTAALVEILREEAHPTFTSLLSSIQAGVGPVQQAVLGGKHLLDLRGERFLLHHWYTEPYVPEFLWKSWLKSCSADRTNSSSLLPRLAHLLVGDALTGELFKGSNDRLYTENVFRPIEGLLPKLVKHAVFKEANAAFQVLERDVETAVGALLQQVNLVPQFSGPYDDVQDNYPTSRHDDPELVLGRHTLQALQKYLLFLQFRNGAAFVSLMQNTISRWLFASDNSFTPDNTEYTHLETWIHLLKDLTCFFSNDYDSHSASGTICSSICRLYKNILDLELSVGVPIGPNEYISSSTCFVCLEDELGDLSKETFYFFPISPRCIIQLYIHAPLDVSEIERKQRPHPLASNVLVQSAIKSYKDAYSVIRLLNTLVLQDAPRFLIFRSPRSMVRTLGFFQRRHRDEADLDFSTLISSCRTQTILYTLFPAASIKVADLTDDVTFGESPPISCGGFADVWRGIWFDQTEEKPMTRQVAVKVLRAHLDGLTREKLYECVKKEVKAWHPLRHPHVARLHGIMEARQSVALVSPWCENGNLVKYLRDINPDANRYQVLYEVASGVSYLHEHKVIHGDLKGQNILIDAEGKAVITDFGLSKVKEDLSSVVKSTSSLTGGSVRWMAPELFLSQLENEKISISTYSDVYGFATVCWEVLTDQRPYANLHTDVQVTVGVMSGRKPSSGFDYANKVTEKAKELWELMDKCWDRNRLSRPTMTAMCECLDRIRS